MTGIYNIKLDGKPILHNHPNGGQEDMEWLDVERVIGMLAYNGDIKRGSTIEIYCELED